MRGGRSDAPQLEQQHELPVAPGESPFKVKGISYRGIMGFLDKQGEEFTDQVLQSFSPDLQAFYRQPFLGASLYDVLPIRPLTAAIAQRLGVSHRAYLHAGATKQAKFDGRTVYRGTAHLDPFEIVRRHASLKYYSFLQTACVIHEEELRAEEYVRGMPQYLAEWYIAAQEGYLAEALRRAGAKDPTVHGDFSKPLPPDSRPLEKAELVFTMSWS